MWHEASGWIVFHLLGFSPKTPLGEALHFFLYDTVKIIFLLTIIVFGVTFLRTYFHTEKVRRYLAGKKVWYGHTLAALFGIITPFCSCSAVSLFVGFVQARIPMGITFSFLISAPMNNEIAIAMLFTLFGWKIAALYIFFGLSIAIIGGWFIGKFGNEKWLLVGGRFSSVKISPSCSSTENQYENIKERAQSAWANAKDIVGKVFWYVIIGIGIGAFMHGYIPAQTIAKLAGPDNPFSVITAVLIGIPLYSNAAGVMPLIEVLTAKGMMIGTALAFMMSVTALSFPEAVILKKVMTIKLIVLFFGIVALGIILVGYLFNGILG